MSKQPISEIYHKIEEDDFPEKFDINFHSPDGTQTLLYEKVVWNLNGEEKGLRYGENPGQPAGFYKLINGNILLGECRTIQAGNYLVSDIELLQSGKHPGKTNITDVDNALNILRYFTAKPCAVIVKHNNPCGVAKADTLAEAYNKALMADRIAAFGGAVTCNKTVDRETAELISKSYTEVVAAPDFEEGVLEALSSRKNLRVMKISNIERMQEYVGKRFLDIKSLMDGGLILQLSFTPDLLKTDEMKPASAEHEGKKYSIKRAPTEKEKDDMLFGWLVETGITSNSVIYVKDGVTVGIGTGEQDRVGVAEIARDKAYRKLADRLCRETNGIPLSDLTDKEKRAEIETMVRERKGGLSASVMVSDAFFPFRDGIEVGLREGVTAVIQPGGALRDAESIEACNEYNATMVFTGQRCFKH
jgi:phosphoribosylaminoimidazolecarboxamide formyltransferase / IMP cyclohydrolase